MIHTINENKVIAYKRVNGSPVLVATATRKNPGTIWYINYVEHTKNYVRTGTPHARVSGKLPAELQQRMIVNLLDLADH